MYKIKFFGSMGITVRGLTFGGRGRAEHAPYPQMLPPTTAIPRDPALSQSKELALSQSKELALSQSKGGLRNGRIINQWPTDLRLAGAEQ